MAEIEREIKIHRGRSLDTISEDRAERLYREVAEMKARIDIVESDDRSKK